MASNIAPAFLKAIMINEVFSHIDDLDVRWFQDDDRDIFKYCAYLFMTKKHPSYEQIKAIIEVSKDMKSYKKSDLLLRLKFIKEELLILPSDNPISLIKREYESRKIAEGLTEIPKMEHDNKVKLIKKLAENLSEDVKDTSTSILQDEINKFADELETGVANDMTGSIDLTKHRDRGEVLSKQMENWKKILGFNHIMPKFYMFAARPGDFKTSLLIDLNVMLHRMGRKGLYFSFEDTKDDLRIKFIAQMYDRDKKHLYSMKENKDLAKIIRKPRNEKIIIHDRVLDYDKLLPTIEYYMAKFQIDYISLDYVQLFTGKAHVKDRMDVVAQDIMEVTRQYKVPFFCLSQVSKNDTDKDAADSRLHKRHVKESKKLAETPRYMGFLYGDNHTSTRTYNRDKNSWGGCGELTIEFDGPSGKIKDVQEIF